MTDRAFCIFATAIGPCAIAWGPAGLVGVQLPEADEAATGARMRQRFPAAEETAPSPDAAAAIARIVAHLAGDAQDFADLTLDFSACGAFERKVYDAALAIASGRTRAYGDIAREIGEPGAARAVGRALGAHPWPINVP